MLAVFMMPNLLLKDCFLHLRSNQNVKFIHNVLNRTVIRFLFHILREFICAVKHKLNT